MVPTGDKVGVYRLSGQAHATMAGTMTDDPSKSSVASAVVQAPAGTRSFVLRTRALERGTYTATLASGRRDWQPGHGAGPFAEGQVIGFRPPAGTDARSRRDSMRDGFGSIPELLPTSSSRARDTYEAAIREGMAGILPGSQARGERS